MEISELVIYFFIYSIIGWIYEIIYKTIRTKRWNNPGFLYGPYCPIYGVGAVLCILLLQNSNKGQIFLIGALGSAVLEYVTAWVLEKMFHARWWDYSKVPFNINGYICLPASFGFGVVAILVINIIYPNVKMIIDYLPDVLQEWMALILVALISSDITLSISSLTNIEKKMADLEANFDAFMEKEYDKIGLTIEKQLERVKSKIDINSKLEVNSEEDKFLINYLKNLKPDFSSLELKSIGRIRKFTNERYNVFRQKAKEIRKSVNDKVTRK